MNFNPKNQDNVFSLAWRFITKNPEKLTTIRIIFLSAWYRFRILTVKMSKLQKTFGIRDEESPCELDIEDQKCAYRIGMRVEHTCNRTPWQSKCLVKALTASHLLKKRGISHTLYLGVGQNDSKMIAHAWLRSGRLYVTGGNGSSYSMVAKFCNK